MMDYPQKKNKFREKNISMIETLKKYVRIEKYIKDGVDVKKNLLTKGQKLLKILIIGIVRRCGSQIQLLLLPKLGLNS